MAPVGILCSCFAVILSLCVAEYVPAVVWQSDRSSGKVIFASFPSLQKVNSDRFYDFMKSTVTGQKTKPLVVVFLEENLSVEDFSWRDIEEFNVFANLDNITRSSASTAFLSSVQAPVKAIERLIQNGFELQETNVEKLELPKTEGKILIVNLNDASVEEDRPDFLRRHDETVSEAYKKLVASGLSVVAVYTGRHSSWFEPEKEQTHHRVRRLLDVPDDVNSTTPSQDAQQTPNTWMTPDNKIILHTSSVVTLTNGSESVELGAPFDVKSDFRRTNEQRMIAIFSGGITLRLIFPLSNRGYWNLSRIEVRNSSSDTVLQTQAQIEAPLNFSYHCSKNIVFSNGVTLLNFSDIQVQPYAIQPRFSDAYDCVWFFTTPIWAGLFVMTILAMILVWGLLMIMDIKTMDQFDDPKGKTIFISATE